MFSEPRLNAIQRAITKLDSFLEPFAHQGHAFRTQVISVDSGHVQRVAPNLLVCHETCHGKVQVCTFEVQYQGVSCPDLGSTYQFDGYSTIKPHRHHQPKHDHIMTKTTPNVSLLWLSRASKLLVMAITFSFFLMFWDRGLARDMLYLNVVLLAVAIAPTIDWKSRNFRYVGISLALLACAMLCLNWYYTFREPDEFAHLYTQYFRLGKILCVVALTVFFVANTRLRLWLRWNKALLIGAALAINIYAIFVGLQGGIDRVTLALQGPTTTAYVLTLIDIFMMRAILGLNKPWNSWGFVVAVALAYCAIILTGTRSAMIFFPVITIIVATVGGSLNRRDQLKMISGITILVVLASPIYLQLIEKRAEQLREDMKLLSANNANTSAGSRVAMAKASLHTGWKSPLGQSAAERASDIQTFATHIPPYWIADKFVRSHMHSDPLESYSLLGIPGALSILGLYLALIVTASRRETRNPTLLAVTCSMIAFGSVDVILMNREACIMYLTGIILAILFDRDLAPNNPFATPDHYDAKSNR